MTVTLAMAIFWGLGVWLITTGKGLDSAVAADARRAAAPPE